MSRINYRKIYESHYGKIPVDDDGRTYEIHHIDGDRSNNDPSNLKAVSIQEHYDIHLSQNDFGACLLISRAMKVSPSEKSELARKHVRRQVENGTHNLLGGEISRRMNAERLEEGTHKFLDEEWQKEKAKVQIENGTHNFCGGDIQRQRIENGTHNFLGNDYARQQLKNGTHNFLGPDSPSQFTWHCEHCHKTGRGKGNYTRCHGDNCKMNKELEV
jgi:hypothetical protein